MRSPFLVAVSRQSAAIVPSSLRRFPKRCCALALALILNIGVSFAQYSIDWSKIAGGGGTSTNGGYSLSGTIGQPDAGGPMTNGPYSLVRGFRVLPTLVQTPGAPILHITNAAPGFATIWWTPPTPGFTLQSTEHSSSCAILSLNGLNRLRLAGPALRMTRDTPV